MLEMTSTLHSARTDSGNLDHLFDEAETDEFLQSIGHTAGDWYVREWSTVRLFGLTLQERPWLVVHGGPFIV